MSTTATQAPVANAQQNGTSRAYTKKRRETKKTWGDREEDYEPKATTQQPTQQNGHSPKVSTQVLPKVQPTQNRLPVNTQPQTAPATTQSDERKKGKSKRHEIRPQETDSLKIIMEEHYQGGYKLHKELASRLELFKKDLLAEVEREREALRQERAQFEKEKEEFHKKSSTQHKSNTQTQSQNGVTSQPPSRKPQTAPVVQPSQNRAPVNMLQPQTVQPTKQKAHGETLPKRTPQFLNNLCSASYDFGLRESELFHLADGKPISVHYTRELSKMGPIIQKELHKQNTIVSMAMTWNGELEGDSKTALITIATSNAVYLFHLVDCIKKGAKIPVELVNLLVDDKIVKIGYDISGEVAKIYHDWDSLYVSAVLNVGQLQRTGQKRITFAEIVNQVLGLDASKILPPLVDNDNWETEGLTGAQLLHEAKNAVLVQRIAAEKYQQYAQNVVKVSEKKQDPNHKAKSMYEWVTKKFKVSY